MRSSKVGLLDIAGGLESQARKRAAAGGALAKRLVFSVSRFDHRSLIFQKRRDLQTPWFSMNEILLWPVDSRYNYNMEPVTKTHIDSVPGRCGGKPCIAGTRIRVWDIYVWHELNGQSAAEISTAYPQVSVAAVHAALAYFHDNQEEIRQQMQEGKDFVEQLRATSGPGLLESLRGRDAKDTLPS